MSFCNHTLHGPALLVRVVLTALLFSPAARVRGRDTVQKARTCIYLLDTSYSMTDGTQMSFRDMMQYMLTSVAGLDTDDHLIVITFDETVEKIVDERISSSARQRELLDFLSGAEARGSWTWLRRGFEVLRREYASIIADLPGRDTEIFILTDGRDDPPPGSSDRRTPLDQLMREYFSSIEKDGVSVYAPGSFRDLLREKKPGTAAQYAGVEKVSPPLQAERVFSSAHFSAAAAESAGQRRTDLPGTETAAAVQQGSLPSHIERNSSGDETASPFSSAPEPRQLVTRKFILSTAAALTAVILLYFVFIQATRIWAEEVHMGKCVKMNIRGWKKHFLGDFDMPAHFLIKDRFGKSVFLCESHSSRLRSFRSGETLPCLLPSGRERQLIFYLFEPAHFQHRGRSVTVHELPAREQTGLKDPDIIPVSMDLPNTVSYSHNGTLNN